MNTPRIVTLTRNLAESGPLGTFGTIDTGTYKCRSLERPRKGLIADHPCFDVSPAGGYDVFWTVNVHPHHLLSYEIFVPDRTAILLHSANWMEQLLGCVAPCKEVGPLAGNWDGKTIDHIAGLRSHLALEELIADLDKRPFKLIVKEA